MDHHALAQLLGNYGEFVGAIAVVVTLGYLAVQIRQSTATAQATATHSFFDTINRVHEQLDDEHLHKIMKKGFQSMDGLEDFEQQRFYNWLYGFLNHIHMGYRLYQRGVLDESVYATWEDAILAIIQLPGARYWWNKNRFPQDFQTRIDERLNDPGSLPERFDQMFPWWGARP